MHNKDIKKEVITQLKNEFPNWNRVPHKIKKEIPCPCRCNPEVYTEKDLFLEDNAPQIVRDWIIAKKRDIAVLNDMFVVEENPRHLDEDDVLNWKDKVGKMKTVLNKWLIPRLAEAKKPAMRDLERRG